MVDAWAEIVVETVSSLCLAERTKHWVVTLYNCLLVVLTFAVDRATELLLCNILLSIIVSEILGSACASKRFISTPKNYTRNGENVRIIHTLAQIFNPTTYSKFLQNIWFLIIKVIVKENIENYVWKQLRMLHKNYKQIHKICLSNNKIIFWH